MTTKRDVILTIYANSTQAPYIKWAAKYFSNPPLILSCPGQGGSSFRAQIQKWAATGDIYQAAVAQLAPQESLEIGRRGLITFSVGWAGGEELLKIEKERNRLDAYLLLDGCHSKNLEPWFAYAKKAAALEAIMIMTHSSIIPPFVSSTITNTNIFKTAQEWLKNSEFPYTEQALPEYILQPSLPKEGIKVALGMTPGLSAISKTWTADPLKDWENIGNLTRIGYSGNNRPDHAFIAWYVSERIFKWLGEEWRT